MGTYTSHLEHCLERIRSIGAEADTLLPTRRDLAARAEAIALDGSSAPGLLAGQVLAVKALFDVAGWTTHAGSAVLRDDPPAQVDAALVAELRSAGAVLLAQSNMTEFAYGALGLNQTFGTPSSPFYPLGERVSGGSTSGGAVAVAKGLVDIALGSDTSGSVRIPAAFCGVAGFKPSKGRYDEHGMSYLAPTFDTPGIIAESAAACRRIDIAITGGDYREEEMLVDLRVGVPREIIGADVDPRIAAAFEAWLEQLDEAGARIIEHPLPSFPDSTAATRHGSMIAVEAFVVHRELLARAAHGYDPRVGSRIQAGEHVPAHDYAEAQLWLAESRRWFDRESRDLDIIVTPTVDSLPPRVADLVDDADYLAANARSFRLTEFANRLDLPSISIPGDLRARQPYGLLLTGRRGDDERVLDIAAAVERHLSTPKAAGSFDR